MPNESQTVDGSDVRQRSHIEWRALFIFTQRNHALALLPAICFSIASGIIEPAMTIFVGKFFNAFADFSAGNISSDELMDRVNFPVYAFLILGGSMIILRGGACSCWTIFGEMQAKKVREDLFHGFLEKDLEWFEMRERGVGNLLSRLQTQIRELQVATSLPLGNVLTYTVESFAAMGIAFYYSWKLTCVIYASVPVMAISMQILSRRIQPMISLQNEALLSAARVSNTAISQISLLKCFNTQNKELLYFVGHIMKAAKFFRKQMRLISLQVGLLKFMTTTIFIQGLWYGNTLVHGGSLTAGKVVTTFWAALMGIQAFQTLLPPLIVLEKGRIASSALLSVLSTVKRGRIATAPPKGVYPDYCEGDIQVSGVSFAYSTRPEHYVLQDCHLRFPVGRTTFLVGRSGSGKSTVSNLLVHFYPVSDGTITIDGHDISVLDPAFLRNNITLVQQQSILFNETILKNISFGHQYHDRVEYEQIDQCLEVTGLQTTIAALPEGVMTSVGVRGTALSGGQKQQIALARARLRNTPILVLDEATSAVDHITRLAIMEHLRSWRKGKTTVIITHDMSLINDDDYVYILDNGSVVNQDYKRNLSAELCKDYGNNSAGSESLEFKRLLDEARRQQKCAQTTFDQVLPQTYSVTSNPRARTRRDSLEFQLELVAQDRTSLASRHVRRTQLLSTIVYNRPSLVAAFDEFIRPPIPTVPSRVLDSEQKEVANIKSSRPSALFKTRKPAALKPNSGGRRSDKALPTPQVFEATDGYRRASAANYFSRFSENERRPLPLGKILGTVWPELDSTARLKIMIGVIALLIQASMPACFAFIMVYILQMLYADPWKAKALKYSAILLGVALCDGVASCFSKYLLETVAQVWSSKIQVEAMRRILEQPRAWFDQDGCSSAYLTSALDRNAEDMRSLVGRFLPLVICCVIMAAVTTLWAMILCWKLALVALAAAPIVYIFTKCFDIVSALWESRTNSAGDLVAETFDETFTNIKTVRTLTLESYFHRKYHLAKDDAFSIGLRRGAYIGLFFGLSECTLNFMLALVFYYGAYLAKHGGFTNTQILHTTSLLIFGASAGNGVINFIPQLASSVDAASRLLHLAQLTLRSHEYSGHLRLNRHDPCTLSGPIHFINNSFYYPTRASVPALKKVNLYVAPHQCTAIVGPSGSGKTTIASLLLGLYPSAADAGTRAVSDATDGPPSLTLSGRDIRTLDLATLREMIALVPQTPVIFPASVRENISYGLDPSSNRAGQANIQLAAQQAGIHDFIMSLPNQYETIVGDGGVGVSGGQAQRIVIARAMVRRPKILILDEPTSALDSESAEIIKRSIKSILAQNRGKSRRSSRGGLTVIIITHARDMMEFAENIVVMEAGSVVEEGVFKDLMEQKGKLWNMLRAGSVTI